MFTDNKNFYPTPSNLISKMISKIEKRPKYILEPSCGSCEIVKELKKASYDVKIHGIEIDPNLRVFATENKIKLVEFDFLKFSGFNQYDLIIANPPFDEGEKHLKKAISIMHSGQIIFLLNAETLKNPYSLQRKALVDSITNLNADIEYIEDAFLDADRKTKVEVALISIIIKNDVDELLTRNCNRSKRNLENVESENSVVTNNKLEALVVRHNHVVNVGLETIRDYIKNYPFIGSYINLKSCNDNSSYYEDKSDIIRIAKEKMNKFIEDVRVDFWVKALDLKEFKNKLTENKRQEFQQVIQHNSELEFTTSNIRQILINLCSGYEDVLINATVELFNSMSLDYAYHKDLHTKNVHYFDGWKTNKAYIVNKKVIMPMSWNGGFIGLKLSWDIERKIEDIEKVMNFFAGRTIEKSISETINIALSEGKTKKIDTEFFLVTLYKKGTVHFEFKDVDILRRFNVTATKGKNWLPHDYGSKAYDNMNEDEKVVVNSFEGKKTYNENIGNTNTFKIIECIGLLEFN